MPARQPDNKVKWDVSMSKRKRYRMRGVRVAHLRELQPSKHWRAAAASCTVLGPTDAKLMTMPLAACCISSALSDAVIVGVAGVLRWAGQPQSDPGCSHPNARLGRVGVPCNHIMLSRQKTAPSCSMGAPGASQRTAYEG